jgi:CRISPR-associated protein Cas1
VAENSNVKKLPLRPRCDLPDFRRIAIELAKLGGVPNLTAHSKTLRSEYQAYCRAAAHPYSWRPFCQAFRLWEKKQEAREDEKAERYAAELDASEDYWRGVACPKGRVIILSGGLTIIQARGGELRLFTNYGPERREEIWLAPGHRMPHAIVFSGFGGSVSLEAVRFCARHNIALVFLDQPGELISFAGPPLHVSARMFRAQSRADTVKIARILIAQKIVHCIASGRLTREEADAFTAGLAQARTVAAIMKLEARAAKNYWSRFAIHLAARKGAVIPPQWQIAAGRPSSLGPGPKRATRPVNAMLNYAYAITLGRLAACLHASGACLAAGFLHADKPGRYSLAYDALEPLRPLNDARVSKWIASHKFARGDFTRLRSGEIGLSSQLAKVFGQEAALPQSDIAQACGFLLSLLAPV